MQYFVASKNKELCRKHNSVEYTSWTVNNLSQVYSLQGTTVLLKWVEQPLWWSLVNKETINELIIDKKALDTIPRLNKKASLKRILSYLLFQEKNHKLKEVFHKKSCLKFEESVEETS